MKNNWINKHEEHIENKLCYKVLIEKVQPKQETTLEEVANEYAKNRYSPEQGFPEEDYYISFLSFRAGAKWQQEQDKNKYSEEDLKYAFDSGRVRLTFDKERPFVFKNYEEFIEKFKNK